MNESGNGQGLAFSETGQGMVTSERQVFLTNGLADGKIQVRFAE